MSIDPLLALLDGLGEPTVDPAGTLGTPAKSLSVPEKGEQHQRCHTWNTRNTTNEEHLRSSQFDGAIDRVPFLAGSPAEPLLDVWSDANEERAAIIEYDGGILRAWAEGFARLDAIKPPGDVPPRRWRQFIDDCGKFLDEGWAVQAAALGWRTLDLFGCDRHRPLARYDHAGLMWLLEGRRLITLSESTATIETATGARQTYRRCHLKHGRVVLGWEPAR